MTIFSELEEAVTKTQRNIESTPAGTPEHQEQCAKLATLNAVARYIAGGAWSKTKGGHERVMLVLKSKNYAEAAQKLNTSEESLRSSVHQASKRIRSTIGFDVISEIVNGSSTDAFNMFVLRTSNAASEIFSAEALAQFPKDCTIKKVDANSFFSAVKALRAATNRGIEDVLNDIDDSILGTVHYLLFANDIKYLREAAALYQYFTEIEDMERLQKRLNIKTKGGNTNATAYETA